MKEANTAEREAAGVRVHGLLRTRWRTLAACGLLGAVAGLVVTLLQISGGDSPWLGLISNNRYESRTVLQINPPNTAWGTDSTGSLMAGSSLPFDAYVESEMAKITGRRVLARVGKSLDLDKRWKFDADTIEAILKRSISVSRVGNGNLVEITVTNRDRELARDIAAETARAFRDECNQTDDDATQRMIEGLKRQVRMQEDQVEQTRKLLAQIVRVKGIVHPADRIEWTPVDCSAADERVRGLKARVELLEKAAANPALALAVDTPDNPVKAIYPKFVVLERRLAATRNSNGSPGQQPVEDIQRDMEVLREQLAAGVDAMRAEAEALLELAVIEQAKSHAADADLRKSAVLAAIDRADYEEAHATYRMESDLLDGMKNRLANVGLEAGLRPSRVAVVEDPAYARFKGFGEGAAAVSLAPRNLFRGTVAGILVGLAVALLLEMRVAYAAGKRTTGRRAGPETTGEEPW